MRPILAAAAIALHAQLGEHDADRLGTCAGDRCADAYIDASPAGDRRFCRIAGFAPPYPRVPDRDWRQVSGDRCQQNRSLVCSRAAVTRHE